MCTTLQIDVNRMLFVTTSVALYRPKTNRTRQKVALHRVDLMIGVHHTQSYRFLPVVVSSALSTVGRESTTTANHTVQEISRTMKMSWATQRAYFFLVVVLASGGSDDSFFLLALLMITDQCPFCHFTMGNSDLNVSTHTHRCWNSHSRFMPHRLFPGLGASRDETEVGRCFVLHLTYRA